MKWLMEFKELYSVNCKVLYFVFRLFPFKSFYEENGFYVFKCKISKTWIQTIVTMLIEYIVQR